MTTAKITFYPVGNGDMTLLEFASGRVVLIDVNIRAAADDEDDDTPDVAAKLRKRLSRDAEGRLYVDAFLLSHPDHDHCAGLRNHFHLGPADEWNKDEDKIFIRELWSSPMIFRRASKNRTLCADAKAFQQEARRRVKQYREGASDDGDRVLLLGEDENGKTDDLEDILVRRGDEFSTIAGEEDDTFVATLLGPLPPSDDEEEEEALEKNRSSTIIRFSLSAEGEADACRYLTGGDAHVGVWERLWQDHKENPDVLSYDLLLTPHHCSWHTLSHDSWSDLGEEAAVSEDARNALAQTRDGANLIASSEPIKDDDNDPPCIRAKREYEAIAEEVGGVFRCVGEYPKASDPDEMEFEVTKDGPRLKAKRGKSASLIGGGLVGREPLRHG